MRVYLYAFALLAMAFSAACKDEGTVRVHRLSFKGVKAVDEGRLKSALATKQSSIIPWGRKYYFDRSRFDADLKRVQAFYADRGYPDARVTSFDVKLNDKQDQVDLTVTVAEGEPVKVAAIDFAGFDAIPAAHLDELKKAGMQITELSATEQAKLRDKLKPVVEKHGAAIAATVAEMQAELAKLRK